MTPLIASTPSTLAASVLVAGDHAAIRELLTHARAGAAPAVIVRDLGLPLRDGKEFLEAWHPVEASPHVAVLVVSASSELPRRLTGGGVGGHITKPFDVDAVVEAVSRLAAMHERGV